MAFGGNTNISYALGVDAVDVYPNMFLTMDRNIALDSTHSAYSNQLVCMNTNESDSSQPVSSAMWTSGIHSGNGNIGLADGSVQMMTSTRLRDSLANSGDTGYFFQSSSGQSAIGPNGANRIQFP